MKGEVISLSNKEPVVSASAFIAPGAFVLGDVFIGENSSVYYNAVLRGDLNSIRIGNRTNIQDNVTVHLSKEHGVVIGDDVTVGHNAVLHGCVLENGVTIGMGSIVMDGAVIRKDSIVGAGAVVTAGKEFPEGALILGMPAKFVRELTENEKKKNRENTRHYTELLSEVISTKSALK